MARYSGQSRDSEMVAPKYNNIEIGRLAAGVEGMAMRERGR
jgi:hypothetical protein